MRISPVLRGLYELVDAVDDPAKETAIDSLGQAVPAVLCLGHTAHPLYRLSWSTHRVIH